MKVMVETSGIAIVTEEICDELLPDSGIPLESFQRLADMFLRPTMTRGHVRPVGFTTSSMAGTTGFSFATAATGTIRLYHGMANCLARSP